MDPVQAPSIYSSLITLKLNHRLFLNALEGVSEDQAKQRISEHSNPFIWIAGHTVWASYNILNFLGRATENPYKGKFESSKPYNASDVYPSLESIKAEWKKVGSLIKVALHEVTEEHLAAESAFKSPIGDFTNGGSVAFLVQHESYEIGQMAFLKKYLTKEAMKYQ